MINSKLIFIILSKTIFFVHFNKASLCEMKSNKTEAFMHAFNNLIIPGNSKQSKQKDHLYAYQEELLNNFIKAHKNNFKYMFEDPMTWCDHNIEEIKGKQKISNLEGCKRFMNSVWLRDLSECTQETALIKLFTRLKNDHDRKYANEMQKIYLGYVASIIELYVQYTSVRSPSDYCNNIKSPPSHLIYFKGINEFELYEYSENIKTLEEIPSVSQDEIFNIIEQIASSSGVDKGKRQKLD